MQLPPDVLCGILLFFFFCRAFCQTALCSLLRWLHVILRSVLVVIMRKATGLGCTGVKYERHKIHAKLFFFFSRIDKYRSCWFIHAFSGFVEVHPCGVFNVLEFGTTTTCWGLLASLARFSFTPTLSKAHSNEGHLKRNVSCHEQISSTFNNKTT